MLCSGRDLREELSVIDAQSSKLVRFEDSHVDALFLEGAVQVFHHLPQTRLSCKFRHNLAHFAVTTFAHSVSQIQKAGVGKVVVVDLPVSN